ncbi:MAG TPA: hypothetical protein VKE69_01295, partial [Planctomycetota bacterium]|nr:hypothetical protein [Planctomycetota bacterium]
DAAGKPVAEAFVWLEGIGDRTWMGDEYPVVESVVAGRKDAPLVRSDASGAFRIRGLLPRNYRIDAMDAKTLAVGSAEGVAAGRSDVRIAIPANATHARLAGRVESLGGEPLAGIQVRPARMTFHTFRMAYTEDLPLVTTDAQGRFELRDVAREGVFIQAVGESIIPGDVAAPFANPEDVHIVVSRRCHMQVELVDANEGVDGFSVFDADGKRLVIRSFRGPMTISSDSESIDSGRSKVVGVDETAKTMALFRKDKEVRRVPLALKPGELTVVRP